MRYVILILAMLIGAAFVTVNWTAINQPTDVHLFFTTGQAPLALMLLVGWGILFFIVVCVLIAQQSSALLSFRRVQKELDEQRKLASSAEDSRLNEFKNEVEKRFERFTEESKKVFAEYGKQTEERNAKLVAEISAIAAVVKADNIEVANTVSSNLGMMDDKLSKILINSRATSLEDPSQETSL